MIRQSVVHLDRARPDACSQGGHVDRRLGLPGLWLERRGCLLSARSPCWGPGPPDRRCDLSRCGEPVGVVHGGGQCQCLRQPDCSSLRGHNQCWRLVDALFLGRRAAVEDRIDLPHRVEPSDRLLELPTNPQIPYQFFVVPVARHPHAKGLAIHTRVEERRLPLVAFTRLHPVVRADRHMHFLDMVPVDVTEVHLVAAIRVPRPPVKEWGDGLSRAELEIERVGLRGGCSRHAENEGESQDTDRRDPPR